MNEIDKWILAALREFGPWGENEDDYDLANDLLAPLVGTVRNALRIFDLRLLNSRTGDAIANGGVNVIYVGKEHKDRLRFIIHEGMGRVLADKTEADVIKETKQRLRGDTKKLKAFKKRFQSLKKRLKNISRRDALTPDLRLCFADEVLGLVGLDHLRAAKFSWRWKHFRLQLIRIDKQEPLPKDGKRQVIVVKDKAEKIHIRVFNENAICVVNEADVQLASQADEFSEFESLLAPHWERGELPRDQKEAVLWAVESILRRSEQQREVVRDVILAFGCGWGRHIGIETDPTHNPDLISWRRRWPRALAELQSRIRGILLHGLKRFRTTFRVEGLDLRECTEALTRETTKQESSLEEEEENSNEVDEYQDNPEDGQTDEEATDFENDQLTTCDDDEDTEEQDQAHTGEPDEEQCDIEDEEVSSEDEDSEVEHEACDLGGGRRGNAPVALQELTDLVIRGGSIRHRLRQIDEAEFAGTFTEDCVKNWASLIKRLSAEPKDWLSKFVWDRFGPDMQTDCSKWKALSRLEKDRLQLAAVHVIKHIIESDVIDRAKFEDTFDGLVLRCATPRALDHNEKSAQSTDREMQLTYWHPAECTLHNYHCNLLRGPAAGPAAFNGSLLFQYLHIHNRLQCADVWCWLCPDCAEFDLRVMQVADLKEIPQHGKNSMYVARDATGLLHFRVFNRKGKSIAEKAESDFSDQADTIKPLKQQLDPVWSQHLLSDEQKKGIIVSLSLLLGCGKENLSSRCRNCNRPFDPARHKAREKRAQYFIAAKDGGSHVQAKFRKCQKCQNLFDRAYSTCPLPGCQGQQFRNFDVRLISLPEDGALPDLGDSLVVIARGDEGLYFRIFDGAGTRLVDKPETELKVGLKELGGLKTKLAGLWGQRSLKPEENQQVIQAVTPVFNFVPYNPSPTTLWYLDGRRDRRSIFRDKKGTRREFEIHPDFQEMPATHVTDQKQQVKDSPRLAQFLRKWIEAAYAALCSRSGLNSKEWLALLRHYSECRKQACPELEGPECFEFLLLIDTARASLSDRGKQLSIKEEKAIVLLARFCVGVPNVRQMEASAEETAEGLQIRVEDLKVVLKSLDESLARPDAEGPVFTGGMTTALRRYLPADTDAGGNDNE